MQFFHVTIQAMIGKKGFISLHYSTHYTCYLALSCSSEHWSTCKNHKTSAELCPRVTHTGMHIYDSLLRRGMVYLWGCGETLWVYQAFKTPALRLTYVTLEEHRCASFVCDVWVLYSLHPYMWSEYYMSKNEWRRCNFGRMQKHINH